MPAPIALFVYNRADHAQRTISALQQNTLAADSELFVYSDAPRDRDAVSMVIEVRNLIRDISGFKAVHVIERDQNWGLAKSIITGVSELVERYGRVIVLEDDLVTSPYFLEYMNAALDEYENADQVMHISGYMFPINGKGLRDTFFLRTASCWGWATWARAWRHFDKDPARLIREFNKSDIRRFNMDDAHDFWRQVLQNQAGQIDTWAVFWYASVFQRNGLCLHPARSMVINIGNDGSGVHCGDTPVFEAMLSQTPISAFERQYAEDPLALRCTRRFFLRLNPSLLQRILRKIKSILIRRHHVSN